jgi:hypothetical protein
VSFEVYLQRFKDERAASADETVVRRLLEPVMVNRADAWADIETVDGGAEVYGINDLRTGVSFKHLSGDAIWDLLYDLASRAGFAVMALGRPTCVCAPELVDDLPPELRHSTSVVFSGQQILDVIREG